MPLDKAVEEVEDLQLLDLMEAALPLVVLVALEQHIQ